MNRQTALAEARLESGERQLRVFIVCPEERSLRENFLHRSEVIGLIGCDAERAPGDECATHRAKETGVESAPDVMAAFRPWIGKIEMEKIDRPGREEVLHRMKDIRPEDARVRQAAPADPAARAADPTGEPLHADEIARALLFRERNEKCAVAAAEINRERGTPSEDLLAIERREDAGRHNLGLRKCSLVTAHGRKFAIRTARATATEVSTN